MVKLNEIKNYTQPQTKSQNSFQKLKCKKHFKIITPVNTVRYLDAKQH